MVKLHDDEAGFGLVVMRVCIRFMSDVVWLLLLVVEAAAHSEFQDLFGFYVGKVLDLGEWKLNE